MPKTIDRDEFRRLIDAGRFLVWATLQDRQDFFVQLTPTLRRPVRDVTNEPNHHTRQRIGTCQ